MAEPRVQPIAIIGMGGRFASAPNLERFWAMIRGGVEVLEELTPADMIESGVDPTLFSDPRYVRRATVLDGTDQFDPAFFGISPREAQIIDPQQRVFLECSWEALEHAGWAGSVAGQAVGVYAGVGINTYLLSQILGNPELAASVGGYQLMLGNDKDFLATRVSYKLDLRGPSVSVQTACSTSLVAVVLACQALQRGDCDMALAGGVSILCPQRAGYLFEEGMIFSPDGRCRPFDRSAAGTRGSSGAGVVVLKRLKDAVRDRDTIHSVILGAAINNDGAAKAGYTAPSVEGQVEVIAAAQALAGVDPRSIGYVEAHGTGTALGDPIEVAALTQVFRAASSDVGFCRLGSLKANLGHLDAAAGVASLIKATLALEHHELPPLVNFEAPNPRLGLEASPFFASAEGAAWDAPAGSPRRAGVSSLGIGGTNAHVVLEEAPPVVRSGTARGRELLVLSARTATALDTATRDLERYLLAHPELPLGDVAFTLGVGRREHPERRVVVARDSAEAARALSTPDRAPVYGATHAGGTPQIAFLFSGQGSQHRGMGEDLYREEPVYREAFDRCAQLLEPELGLDLREVVFGEQVKADLDETRLAQPALFATEYALARFWMSLGIRPFAMIGHSIGEYVAAHLAGVMTLEAALRIVAARGRLMQAQAPGSMAAVQLSSAELQNYLDESVELAAVNAPGLCTVSGPSDAVERLVQRLSREGFESRLLHTSHAFHSRMMEPMLGPFVELLAGVELSPPQIPYVSNLTGSFVTDEQATSPAYYARHLREAVRFEAGVRLLSEYDPSALLLEVGPSNALASLSRQVLGKQSRRVFASLPHPREPRSALESALETAGRLWLSGAKLDWEALHAGRPSRRVPLPTYPFERERCWVEKARPVASAAAAPTGETLYYAPSWIRDESALGQVPKPAGRWLVMSRPGALADAVQRRFESGGASVVRAVPGEQVDSAGLAGAVYVLESSGDAARRNADAYYNLVGLAAALEPETHRRALRLVVVTTGAAVVLDEPLHDLGASLSTGPVLVLPVEVPGLDVRSVDFASIDVDAALEAAAAAVAEEAVLPGTERQIARRRGRRFVRRLDRISLSETEASSLPLKARGVYLITGGLGGIGLSLAKDLARRSSARLLLTARTELPPREHWPRLLEGAKADDPIAAVARALTEIEAAGGEVLVASAATQDRTAMRAAIDAARARWGGIDGVIHAAGVPGSGTIALRKSEGELEEVLAPKVDGLSVLVELLGGTSLDFVALFSSINAVAGAAGTADYAAANAYLDAFVDSDARPRAWQHVVAFDWGPWREVGMAAKLAAAAANRSERQAALRHALASDAAVEAFVRGLGSRRNRIVVSSFDPVRAAELATSSSKTQGAAAAAVRKRPEPTTEARAPGSEVERRLGEIWCELLGVDRVDARDDFFELGGHSLLATRVLARVDQAFGARLSLRDVFDAPTLERLSERVEAAVSKSAAAPAADDADREELEF